jgi:hypothetical protein
MEKHAAGLRTVLAWWGVGTCKLVSIQDLKGGDGAVAFLEVIKETPETLGQDIKRLKHVANQVLQQVCVAGCTPRVSRQTVISFVWVTTNSLSAIIEHIYRGFFRSVPSSSPPGRPPTTTGSQLQNHLQRFLFTKLSCLRLRFSCCQELARVCPKVRVP